MNKLLTIGYGRDSKEVFQERFSLLLEPENLIVVDVRKEKAKSRNGRWAYHGWEGMGATLREIGISYTVRPQLANI